MSHANARTTPAGRLLIVQRHQAGWARAHIAAAMGISRKCVATWINRYLTEGSDGLIDRSSRPHQMPTKTAEAIEDRVVEIRRRERVGRDQVARAAGVPPRTVSRILARRGVPHLAVCDPMTGEVIRSSKVTKLRYERKTPGSLVHMDVKKLGRIPDGGGWRAHRDRAGLVQTHENHASRRDKIPIGYDYVHALVDDYSRLAYCEVLPDEKGPTCAGFLARATTYFAAHGVTHIRQLMTDNASAYRWSLREFCTEQGITQLFIRPGCPWQNGKVERLNRTLAIEWAYRQEFSTDQARTAALAPWLEHYNTQRGHSSLGGLPPITRLPPTS